MQIQGFLRIIKMIYFKGPLNHDIFRERVEMYIFKYY